MIRCGWWCLLAVFFLVLLSCRDGRSTGNSTETENAVAFQALDTSGNPVPYADFHVLPIWFVADTSGVDAVHSVLYAGQADAQGWIRIGNHPEGSFVMEIARDSLAATFQYAFTPEEIRTLSDPQVLRSIGSIEGWIALPQGVKMARIGFRGLAHSGKTDSTGHFLIGGLPNGTFGLIAWNPVDRKLLANVRVDLQTSDTLMLDTLPQPDGEDENTDAWRYSQEFHCEDHIPDWMRPVPGSTVITLRFDSDNFDFTQARPDGGDLRLVDPSGNVVPVRREYWSAAARRGVLRVRVAFPQDSAETWTLKWGNPYALAPSQPDVWAGQPDSLVRALYSVLVADFENNSAQTELLPPAHASYWYMGFSDSTATISPSSTESFTSALVPADSGRQGTAAHFTYSAPSPKWVLIGTQIAGTPSSLAHLDSLEFWYRGDGKFQAVLENLDLAIPLKAIYAGNATGAWKRVVITPANFIAADSVAGNYGWNAVRHVVTHMTFFAYGGTEYWIDDIRLYGIDRDDLK